MTQGFKTYIHTRICRICLFQIILIVIFFYQKNYLLHSGNQEPGTNSRIRTRPYTSCIIEKMLFQRLKLLSSWTSQLQTCLLNRSSVARDVLQRALSFIYSLKKSFIFFSKSSEHHHSQTVRDRDLKLWEYVHHPLCVTCHMSRVTCHVSHDIITPKRL